MQTIFIVVCGVWMCVDVCVVHMLVQAWPSDALEMVANKFLEDVELETELHKSCVFICQHFHQSVRKLSEM